MTATRSTRPLSGIVLAGTFPWANSAFDRLSPRPLVPVAQQPLIAFGLSWLQRAGVHHAVICANRSSRALQAKVEREFSTDLDVAYIEDAMPRGAAGCIRDAARSLPGQTFLVTDGAAIPTVDPQALLDAHEGSGAAITVVVQLEARGGGLPPLQVPAGIYVIDRRALEPVAAHGFVDLKEHLIPSLARAGERIATFAADGVVPRVLNAETYLAANEFATQLAAAGDSVPAGYRRVGEALIHRNASVDADITMAGPVMVGEGASIAAGVVLIGPTSIGRDVAIGAGAVVSRSSVWRRSRIDTRASVDRSIVADDGVVERDQRVYRAVVSGRPSSLAVRLSRATSHAVARVTEDLESAARHLHLRGR